MILKSDFLWMLIILLFLQFSFVFSNWGEEQLIKFIAEREELQDFYNNQKVIMVASTGRSGSSLLTHCIILSQVDYTAILKTHLLPPGPQYEGKIIFIFSNPDKAAESALHLTLQDNFFGQSHFNHLESSDKNWLKKIGDTEHQTLRNNLLSYDALGCLVQLERWLHVDTNPCAFEEAQILAIKYEHLWDSTTLEAIQAFLNSKDFSLLPQTSRGYKSSELSFYELMMRKIYNLGSNEMPIYSAYDKARAIWEKAPPYQFLRIK